MRIRPQILRALVMLAFLPLSPASAQDDVAAFFKDKQLKMVVGSAAGDGYDINARVLVRHLVNHIPGKPQIVIQNQPGAASVAMTNALYNGAARDGSGWLAFGDGVRLGRHGASRQSGRTGVRLGSLPCSDVLGRDKSEHQRLHQSADVSDARTAFDSAGR